MSVPVWHSYHGMSYEQASREAMKLLNKAVETGNWFETVDRLIILREIMQREYKLHTDRIEANKASIRESCRLQR